MVKSTIKSFIPNSIFKTMVRSFYGLKGYLYRPRPTYNTDGLTTVHNCDFIKEARFAQAYQLGKATGSWGEAEVQWRAFVACWAANKGATLEGDFVECGVNKGGLALAVMNYVNFKSLPKKFYLLDTFSGPAEKYLSEEEKKLGLAIGSFEDCYDSVKETFKDFNVEIIKGTVPDTLPLVKTTKVAYLSIDMNSAEPEIAAAEFFLG